MKEVYIAHSNQDRPFPAYTVPGRTLPLPYEELSVRKRLFPIAENTTLPPNYYEENDLDIRFTRDRQRAEILASAQEQNIPLKTLRALGSTATEALEPWQYDLPLDQLIDMYSTSDMEDFYALAELFLKAPAELRPIAYQDPASMPEVLEKIGAIQGLHDVATIDTIITTVQSSLEDTHGEERLARLDQMKPGIEEELAKQKQHEAVIINSDAAEGPRLQDARINRKRFIADGIDATLFRFAINNGTIVNPSYLHDPTHYQALEDEPEVTFEEKLSFLRHMMAGHWALGQDHTFIYRNHGERMAAAQTGVKPDYAAIRPGNFIYHDLKLLEHGPHTEDFPLDALFEYARHHYLRQMDLVVLDEDRQITPGTDTLNTFFTHQDQRYIIPLTHTPDHVIPFRALKKSPESSQYYEYDEECYMAELVDIALQLEKIENKRGTFEVHGKIGNTQIGMHAATLIEDLMRTTTDYQAPALAIEQLLFMDGQLPVGGRNAILSALEHDPVTLETLTTKDDPEPIERAPLTCYYEWFLRYARPVSTQELQERGVPNR
jgi:hypothetical protein